VGLARPSLRQRHRVGDVEIDGELLDVVAVGEEQDAPVVLAALEDGRVQLQLLHLCEVLDGPRELAGERLVLSLGLGLVNVHLLRCAVGVGRGLRLLHDLLGGRCV